MPVRWLRAYLAMLPRLQAEESLARITIGSVAAGTIEGRKAREVVRGWQRAADGAPEPATGTGLLTQLASIGFGVVNAS